MLISLPDLKSLNAKQKTLPDAELKDQDPQLNTAKIKEGSELQISEKTGKSACKISVIFSLLISVLYKTFILIKTMMLACGLQLKNLTSR